MRNRRLCPRCGINLGFCLTTVTDRMNANIRNDQSEELLKEEEGDYLCVAHVEEAVSLIKHGINVPILVLGAIDTDQIANFIENDIEIMSSPIDKSTAIQEAARKLGKDTKQLLKPSHSLKRLVREIRLLVSVRGSTSHNLR